MSRTTDPRIEASGSATYPFASSGTPISPTPAHNPPASAPSHDPHGSSKTLHESLTNKHVCPFCGSQNPVVVNGSGAPTVGACPRCTMEDTAATRQATKARIGPWHVLQTRNPAAPGMRYATLLALVAKGQVTARSVLRGPTTHQLWRYAAHVKGISREFGVCYSCGESIAKTAATCTHCERSQEPSGNPDALLETKEPTAPSGEITKTDESSVRDSYVVVAPTRGGGPLVPVNAPHQQQPQVPVSHAERIRAGKRPDGRVLSAMELAAALQTQPSPGSMRHTNHFRNITLTVLLVLAVGIVALCYLRPDLRNRGQDWLQTNLGPTFQKIKDFHLQKQPPTVQQVNAPTTIDPERLPMPVATHTNTDTAVPSVSIQDQPKQPTSPTSASITITPAIPPVTPTVTSSTADNTASGQPNLVQPEHQGILIGPTLTAKDVRALRDRAMDAEARHDYSTAVQCYEQMLTAPKELIPADTKVRLNLDRAALPH